MVPNFRKITREMEMCANVRADSLFLCEQAAVRVVPHALRGGELLYADAVYMGN